MSHKLYVALYRPLPNTGNYQHWALYLSAPPSHPEGNTLIHVLDVHPTFQQSITNGRSVSAKAFSPRIFLKQILLCEVNEADVPQLVKIAREAIIDNETLDWTCQDYVLEILESLEDACLVGFEDEKYEERKQNLKGIYGAMI